MVIKSDVSPCRSAMTGKWSVTESQCTAVHNGLVGYTRHFGSRLSVERCFHRFLQVYAGRFLYCKTLASGQMEDHGSEQRRQQFVTWLTGGVSGYMPNAENTYQAAIVPSSSSISGM